MVTICTEDTPSVDMDEHCSSWTVEESKREDPLHSPIVLAKSPADYPYRVSTEVCRRIILYQV